MGDIHCGNCGEPWESYYVYDRWDELLAPEDIEPDNPKRFFLSGKGCPTCNWGEKEGNQDAQDQHVRDMFDPGNFDEDPLEYL